MNALDTVLDTLDHWRSLPIHDVAVALHQCPRCKAPLGSACVRPDGWPALRTFGRAGSLPRVHARRMDLALPTYGGTPVVFLRADLRDGRLPESVIEELSRSPLYLRLVALSLLPDLRPD